jgi:hypothetical protein
MYNEKTWQKEILEILLLLFPKYIKVLTEVEVLDSYAKKNRRVDFMLVDAVGNIDIVEIKKPDRERIISDTKYRDNYVPKRELSGAVMQVEKYILYLNKWGAEGEKKLHSMYANEFPDKFQLHITNPNGIILMGRTEGLSEEQLLDFEVLKRKYKNIADIITYDDLLNRLRAIIGKFSKGNSIA